MATLSMTVLGGGNGAQAMAADLAALGHDLRLYELPEFAAPIRPVVDSGTIELVEGTSTTRCRVEATTDLAAALDAAELVHVVVPAYGHDPFFEAMLPLLRPEHLVVVWSGRLGSLRLAHLAELFGRACPRIAEVNTLPYGARLESPGRVRVLYRADSLHVAAYPADGGDSVVETLASLYPMVSRAPHVIGSALLNSSLLVLPTGTVLNAGGVESSGGDFCLFRDGLTPAVTRVVGTLNRELAAIARRYRAEVPVYSRAVLEGPGSVEAANFTGRSPEDYLAMRGPDRVDGRYLRENVPYGLVPLAGLARAAGIACPVLDGLIALGDALCGGLGAGRSLGTLGLDGLGPEEIINLVTNVEERR